MFKSHLKAAQERVALLTSLITNAGFDVEALTAADAGADALKDAIAACAPQVDEAAIGQAAVQSFLKASGVEIAEGQSAEDALAEAIGAEFAAAETAAYQAGLKAAGIEVSAEEGKDLTAADVTAAIQASVQSKTAAQATEQLAEAGFNAEQLPAPKSQDKPTEGLTGRDRFLAGLQEAQPNLFKHN